MIFKITATGTGTTPDNQVITLSDGIWNIFLYSATWGSATLEVSNDSEWFTVTEAGETVTFTANTVKEINGGLTLRLNVSAYTADIVAIVKKVI